MFYQTKDGGKSTVTHTQRHDEVIVQDVQKRVCCNAGALYQAVSA